MFDKESSIFRFRTLVLLYKIGRTRTSQVVSSALRQQCSPPVLEVQNTISRLRVDAARRIFFIRIESHRAIWRSTESRRDTPRQSVAGNTLAPRAFPSSLKPLFGSRGASFFGFAQVIEPPLCAQGLKKLLCHGLRIPLHDQTCPLLHRAFAQLLTPLVSRQGRVGSRDRL